VKVISHADDCPVSQPGFVVDPNRTQCRCDFGKRLRAEIAREATEDLVITLPRCEWITLIAALDLITTKYGGTDHRMEKAFWKIREKLMQQISENVSDS
jgi:hypothetical protein